MRTARFGLAAIAACMLLAAPARSDAQSVENTKEFGIDAGVQFGLSGGSYTSLNLPAQRLRIGFFRTPNISIEPYGSLNYNKPNGGSSVTTVALGTGLLYHFSTNRAASQVYARPFAELTYVNAAKSDTQFGLGGGLGIKIPLRERISTRFEAALGYGFASDFKDAGATLNLTAGLSFFTLP